MLQRGSHQWGNLGGALREAPINFQKPSGVQVQQAHHDDISVQLPECMDSLKIPRREWAKKGIREIGKRWFGGKQDLRFYLNVVLSSYSSPMEA